MIKILFLHGLESTPGGSKPIALKAAGYQVFNPYLPKSSWEESLKVANQVFETESPDVVVGSSRGGAIAMELNSAQVPKVLIAPAWKRFNIGFDSCNNSDFVLHSRKDDVVQFEDSIQLRDESGASLIEVGDNHRMSDPDVIESLLDVVKFCTKI